MIDGACMDVELSAKVVAQVDVQIHVLVAAEIVRRHALEIVELVVDQDAVEDAVKIALQTAKKDAQVDVAAHAHIH